MHSLTCALLLSLFCFFFLLVKAGLSPGVHTSALSLSLQGEVQDEGTRRNVAEDRGAGPAEPPGG